MTGVGWTERYRWIVGDLARLNVRHAIIDAEGCCDGEKGITNFERLIARVNDASAYAYAFDMLVLDGRDMRGEPLADRKAALGKLLRKSKPGIHYSEYMTGDGRTPGSGGSCPYGWAAVGSPPTLVHRLLTCG